jgi:hypothetical protein
MLIINAFLIVPPIAFASRLPTVCNLFNPDRINKPGPCVIKTIISQDKTVEGVVAFFPSLDHGTAMIISVQELSFLFPSLIIPHFRPLRC